MTKQLRKQFILVNMLLVGTVLLVVFAALGVSTYHRQVQDSQRVLERYFMEKGNTPSPKLDFGAHRDWKDFPMRFSFCAVLDSDGGLVSYQSENLTLSRQTVEQAVQAAAEEVESTQKESGTLSGLDLRYLAKEQDGQLRIAFVERTQEYASMQDFLVAAFLLGSAGLMVLFLASSSGGAQLGTAEAVCSGCLSRAENTADCHPGKHRNFAFSSTGHHPSTGAMGGQHTGGSSQYEKAGGRDALSCPNRCVFAVGVQSNQFK